ncbi:MAG: YggT family protein [Actinomycetota bacterium]|nr:YggT family protein [Actinomycetota bacterium]
MIFTSSSNFLVILGELYVVVLFVRAILSWFPFDPHSPFNPVRRVVFAITEPLLAPFRRIIPPIGMLDISFIVAIIVVELFVRVVLARIPV